jgi:hypothetical protein
MHQFPFLPRLLRLLSEPGHNRRHDIRSERGPGVERDIVFATQGFDLLEIGELAGLDAVDGELGLDGLSGAGRTDVGGDAPVGVGGFEGADGGHCGGCQSRFVGVEGVVTLPPMKPVAPKTMMLGVAMAFYQC